MINGHSLVTRLTKALRLKLNISTMRYYISVKIELIIYLSYISNTDI